jgi:hypothetical protein
MALFANTTLYSTNKESEDCCQVSSNFKNMKIVDFLKSDRDQVFKLHNKLAI